MSKPVIILGAGGHAKVLIDVLRLCSTEILGILDKDAAKVGKTLMGIPVIGGDEELQRFATGEVELVNGLGSVRVNFLRGQMFERFTEKGYRFARVIHPSAYVSVDAVLAEGVQVMAGAVVQAGCNLGTNVIINSGAVVDHDCHIGRHAHLSSGVTLSGAVRVGEGSHVGAGATVIQGIRIGRNCLVAAGAVVVHDVPDGVAVAGVPARNMALRVSADQEGARLIKSGKQA